ncbi:DUF4252 domain-containing protein [Flavobacterium album]|uniref:DUF4252 domain-containing protein n=1 Tax=Flavobacterium album TaxID=2175091 RepID=A0A2S1QYR4_9FLAO|nr:DUF4252 domain-containing protein [Flavobacterium album]AWH85381.1 DUF4252 domain-containing protein [Flavobacterium album]
MKNVIIAILLSLMPVLMRAQVTAFDKFEDKTGIESVVVNKKMFQLMSEVKATGKDKADYQQYIDLIKKLEYLKVFKTVNAKHSADMKATVDAYLKKSPMDELMRMSDGGRNIKIYVKSGAKASQVRELLMFMDGGKQETVIMSLTGNFDISQISLLTDKLSLPGGMELKKASKSKK